MEPRPIGQHEWHLTSMAEHSSPVQSSPVQSSQTLLACSTPPRFHGSTIFPHLRGTQRNKRPTGRVMDK
ncbi:hypothetical protein Trco_006408 [Trichoderma cornu-damae]|uniref:Uncharacterized protein n=1 Tax=Trichoderma cornu-damae TaxID=654480 RepID=A0A9P8TRT9_9HYPO|nr:hypothetical protein Trco_006408 [Trichoderma cornu-damae]